jgi:pimeloyl-ACP methyl ester carboxylesterase
VLVHGLWLSGWSLLLLRRHLRRCGFSATHAFSYQSVRRDLLENGTALNAYLRTLTAPTVHLVGHSLGGLVIRALFQQYPRQRPGRIVTLGAPHRGSQPAKVCARNTLGRCITGRSIAQLVAGIPEHWPLPSRDFGVIAGSMSLGLGRLLTRLPKPNDGVVALTETLLPGATDHIIVHVSHTALVASRRVADQVCHFLENGRFQPQE